MKKINWTEPRFSLGEVVIAMIASILVAVILTIIDRHLL